MGISEQKQISGKCHDKEEDESDTEGYDSDDSQEDPTSDVLEATRYSFSRLSIKKKSKSRILEEMEEGTEGDPDVVEMVVPELDEKDQKSFEIVLKIIEVGQVEKLKVDQCKVYLRKHGLRLTGNKDTLIGRIKEHLDILNGGGEKKYPASSFVLNCKGDACTGDVVMFEQNVYEMFNIASRSASGPSCGTRIVAGRIVKESYGAAKQQHTFTIEVLWSKGEKPLPPLHPLLIKGRNVYRLKTMRQKWEDEGERRKILLEKHSRGSVARLNREARIQEKEMRKMLKANRVSRVEDQNRKQQQNNKIPTFQSQSIGSEKLGSQPQEQHKNIQKSHQEQNFQQKECWYSKTCKGNTSVPLEALYRRPNFFPIANVPSESTHQRQPLTSMNCNPSRSPFRSHNQEQSIHSNSSKSPSQRTLASVNCIPLTSPSRSHNHKESMNSNPSKSPFRRHGYEENKNSNPLTSVNCNTLTGVNCIPLTSSFRSQNHEESMNSNPLKSPFRRHGYKENKNSNPSRSPFRRYGHEQRQLCRYYAQGRCYYGDQCKYLHEYTETQSYGQRKAEFLD